MDINEQFFDALKSKDIKQVEKMLNKGADVNASHESLRFPLLYAVVFAKDITLVSLLLAKGADVNRVDEENYTALTWAMGSKQEAVIMLLLKYGANFRQFDLEDSFHMLIKREHTSTLKLVLESDLETDHLIVANFESIKYQNNLEILELCLSHCKSIPQEKINSLLLYAVHVEKNEEMKEIALKYGGNINGPFEKDENDSLEYFEGDELILIDDSNEEETGI